MKSLSPGATGGAAPEGIVLRTDPESDVPPAVSGGLGDRYLPGSSTAVRESGRYETGPEGPVSTTYCAILR